MGLRHWNAIAIKAMAVWSLAIFAGGALAQSAPTTPINWASATQGGIASASSNSGPGFSPHTLNNGDRTGKTWSTGGGWKANPKAKTPDWAQVMFDAAQSINTVTVYSVADNYTSGIAPTDTQTFTQVGLTSFDVQIVKNGKWDTVASVTNNQLVKRAVTFADVTTIGVRIVVRGGPTGGAGIVQIEATGSATTTSTTGTSTTTQRAMATPAAVIATGAPVVSGFSPTYGPVGTQVTITGSNFAATASNNNVRFNGVLSSSVGGAGSTTLNAQVPTGATTGKISVTYAGQTGTSANSFRVTGPPPTITSFTPTSGPPGTTLTITGTNFSTYQTVVYFTDASGPVLDIAGTVTSVTSTTITVTVPSGIATGPFRVMTYDATGLTGSVDSTTSFGLTVAIPTITSFSPTIDPVGTTVTINGTNFDGTTLANNAVAFNGTNATVASATTTSLTTTVPSGATTGPITVTVSSSTANVGSQSVTSSTNYTVGIPPPTISGFAPTSGAAGTSVTISGTHFGATQGSSGVQLAGNALTPTSWSDTAIAVTIPASSAGVPSGTFTVTVNGQSVTSAGSFTVLPAISSFTPASGPVGTTVTITGSGFSTTAANNTVNFNGVAATVASASGTSLSVTVPSGATTGPIAVTVGGNTATSASNFSVLPGVTGLSPSSGIGGTAVTISGTSFSTTVANNTVKFNGVSATVTSATATSLSTSVPITAATGPVSVTVGGLTGTSSGNFIVPAPTISSFAPTSGPPGTTVTITGTNFSPSLANNLVEFADRDGTTLDIGATVTAVTPTSITVTVPGGSYSGKILVGTPAGSGTSSTSFTVTVPTPTITGFTPTVGPAGTVVTISGTNFDGTTASNNVVSFNGAAVTPSASTSTSLTATVPSNATTGAIAVTVSSSQLYIGSQSVTSSGTYTVGYPQPTITSFSPTSGGPITLVTITGTNFGTDPYGVGSVMMGSTPVAIMSWSDTSIKVWLPYQGTSGPFTVTTPHQMTVTSTQSFQYTAPPPPTVSITGISPSGGPPSTVVTIKGTAFSTAPGGNKLTFFNGVAVPDAQVTPIDANHLQVIVPDTAQTGPIGLVVGTQSATSPTFTVVQKPALAAQFISQVPFNIAGMQNIIPPSATENVAITFKNTGTTTWTAGQNFKLGQVNADWQWTSTGRATLSSSVAPGGYASFNFAIQAPSTLGQYGFNWQMVQDNPGNPVWFGDMSDAVIQVGAASNFPNAPASISATPAPSSVTLNWTAPPTGGAAPTRYYIAYRLNTYAPWGIITELPVSQTSLALQINPGVYYFGVMACTDAGLCSPYISTLQITIPAGSVPSCKGLSASPDAVSFASNGGSATFSLVVPAQCAWSISSTASPWLDMTPTSGTGPGTPPASPTPVTITLTTRGPNTSTAALTGTLTITGDDGTSITVAVSQAGVSGSCTGLATTPTSISFPASGGAAQTLQVSAPPNCDWVASAGTNNWFTVAPASGSTSGVITVTPKGSNIGVPLNGLLTLSGYGVALNVPVTQAGPVSVPITQPATVAAIPATDSTSDAVGATAAQFRVDEGGNATYSIPIQVPPGTAGLTPKLALSYNSRLPGGVMGPGWAIEGASAITRCRQTRESGDFMNGATPIDGNPPAVNFTTSDRFCLDGVRLLMTSGTSYGATGSVYSPENDPTTQVTATASTAAIGPDSFKVQRKDGSTSTYGNTTASASALLTATPSGSSTAVNVSWNLARVQDSVGNYIDYLYTSQPAKTNFSSLPFASAAVETVLAQVNYTGHLTGTTTDVTPYASVTFNYVALSNTANVRVGYQGGVTFLQSQQLSNVTVSDTSNGTLRYYALSYQTSTSGSSFQQLSQVKECRDGTQTAVCFPPTVFTWSQASYALSLEGKRSQTGPDFTSFAGYKVADIDGDGRPDLIWAKDGDPGCPTGVSRIYVSFLDQTATGQMTLVTPTQAVLCATIDLKNADGSFNDQSWYLTDYNGDGRADLMIGGAIGSNWKVFASQGRPTGGGAVFSATDLLAGLATPISVVAYTDPFGNTTKVATGMLADLNGDGLPDFIYPSSSAGGIQARLLTRASNGTLSFSAPYDLTIPTDTQCTTANFPNLVGCEPTLFSTNGQTHRSVVTADVNGDGRADLTVAVHVFTDCPACAPAVPPAPPRNYWVQYVTNSITPPSSGVNGSIQMLQYWVDPNARGSSIPVDNTKMILADLNGDGLTDILYQDPSDSTGQTYTVLINTGNGYLPGISVSGITNGTKLQLADVNGDGRLDIVFPHTLSSSNGIDTYDYWSYVSVVPDKTAASGWAFTAPATALNEGTDTQNNTDTQWVHMFGDFDGDGATDMLAIQIVATSGGVIQTARATGGGTCTATTNSTACSRYHPRDVVTTFTNGYGAYTTIAYQPLTNVGVYQRGGASGYPALTTASYGWGSPVFDVLAPMYVASQAKSSAPTQGSAAAMSTVYYRYAGAVMQAGGRGFLGFAEIWSFDDNDAATTNQYVATVNHYAQQYPFIGMPVRTIKEVLSGAQASRGNAQLDACASNSEATGCFSGITGTTTLAFQTPWPDLTASSSSGIWISQGTQQPMCTGAGCNTAPAASQCALNATLPAIASGDPTSGAFTPASSAGPVFAYIASTADTQYDLNSGTAGSPVAIAATRNFFCYDSSNGASPTVSRGDLLGSLTVSQDGAGTTVAQKATSNTYADNASLWYFGRLAQSTVTFARPQQSNVSRSTSYTYDPATGLLTSERIQSGGSADQDLRTLYDHDKFGNRTAAYQCSADISDDTECRTHARTGQQQSGTTVLRYAKTTYSNNGRYVTGSSMPFYSTSATNNWNEKQATSVDARDEFGNPVQQHSVNDTSGNMLNSVATTQFAKFGVMGRPYFAGDSSGHATTTTFRMCGNGATCSTNTDTRFVFRSQTLSVGSPSSWTYYDVLGRPVLQIAQSFDKNGTGQLFTGACSYFDAHNRPSYKSEPFFVNVAAAADGSPNLSGVSPCSSASYATTTQYDVLGRVVNVTAPDNSLVTKSYVGLTTATMNQRSKTWRTTTNALGEVIQSDDPGAIKDSHGVITGGGDTKTNLSVTQTYDAAGNVLTISRNAGNGAVTTTFTYDVLGRKLSQSDADSGQTSFTYNAAGDVLTQTDAKNQIITLAYDALGRKWQRTTSGASDSNNVADNWSYDTAANGYGQLASESHSASSGTYTAMSRAFAYDTLGRLNQRTTSIAGSSYTEATAYDSLGRPRQQQDASGQVTLTHYTANGFVDAQTDTHTDGVASTLNSDANSSAQQLLYELLGTNERGQPVSERRGGTNNLITGLGYYAATGRLAQVCSGPSAALSGTTCSGGTLQDLAYAYDLAGNLTTRVRNYGNSKNPAEMFTYDALNRLTQTQLGTLQGSASGGSLISILATQAQTYDALGNLCSQAVTGSLTNTSQTYTYAGPAGCTNHGSVGSAAAVTAISGTTSATYGYDADGNQTTRSDGRTLTYNVLNQIASATLGSNTTKFEYGPDGDRFLRNDNGVLTLYIGKVEIQKSGGTVTEVRRYLGAAIDLVVTNSTRYTFGDHLGSVDTIAKKDGTRVEAGSFDAWGNRRNPDNWQNAGSTAPLSTTTHGFTGHEHVDALGFIHMNGRIYDPQLGRMMQADPMANPGSQGLNRYAYVANNPLTLTDPTGYNWLHTLDRIAGWITFGPLFGSIQHDYYAFLANPYVRMVGALVASYFTFGAASAAFGAMGVTGIAAGIGAGAAAGFTYGAIASGGSMEAALQSAIFGGVLGGLGALNSVQPRDFDWSFEGAAKYTGKQILTNWERDETDRFFARKFGIKGWKLDAVLTVASFAANKVFGSRYEGKVNPNGDGDDVEYIGGIGDHRGLGYNPATDSNSWGNIANAIDVVLMTRGLPTAPAWQYVFAGDRSVPLVGYSLGAGDVNNLVAYGLGSHVANYSISLPIGQVGAPTNNVTIGASDPVNGGMFGLLFTPNATVENRGFFDHIHGCYSRIYSLGEGESVCAP